jgi:hypothetical protein
VPQLVEFSNSKRRINPRKPVLRTYFRAKIATFDGAGPISNVAGVTGVSLDVAQHGKLYVRQSR